MPIYKLGKQNKFPPVHHAEDGLLAFGGDLSPSRLLAAYSNGIFPWYSEGDPILWWAPEERMVLLPGEVYISRRLLRTMRSGRFQVVADSCFSDVIHQCANIPRKHEDSTWILPEMIEAYCRLHRLGVAHSIEVKRNGVLVGGLYGVSLGTAFFGESMFSLQRDASKIALAALARQCARWDFSFIDCQMWTRHLERMGAASISRETFVTVVRQALSKPTRTGCWHLDKDILDVSRGHEDAQ